MAAQRRELRFESIDDVLSEVERLTAGDVKTTGNYSYPQILEHLARALDAVCGHLATPRVSLPLRVGARMIRPLVLLKMRPGFKLPAQAQSVLWPSESVDIEDAVTHFKAAVQRYCDAETLPPHPFFGKMTRAQSDQMQCRHCELHLGFVHPAIES